MKRQTLYTIIKHKVRIKLGITTLEYCVADTIYHLSNNPKNKMKGWCYASKDTIAENLGVTRQSIFTIVKKLIELDIVIKDPKTRYLKTSQKWYDNVIAEDNEDSKETLPIVKKLDDDSKETLPYSNIDKKDIYKYISYGSEFLEDEIKRVRTRKEGKQKKMNLIILEYMLDKEMEYPTHKAFLNDFDRCRKPASPIADYSDQDYIATARFFENKNISWTLETIAKHIANKEYKLK